ncbi:MAG: hypothetical protein H7A36_03160 [Chlamydiales bacterium]|nr:hypothetical protein [Chlamydiales bacterium]
MRKVCYAAAYFPGVNVIVALVRLILGACFSYYYRNLTDVAKDRAQAMCLSRQPMPWKSICVQKFTDAQTAFHERQRADITITEEEKNSTFPKAPSGLRIDDVRNGVKIAKEQCYRALWELVPLVGAVYCYKKDHAYALNTKDEVPTLDLTGKTAGLGFLSAHMRRATQ